MEANSQNRPIKNWKTPFFTIWTGQVFSLLGSQLVQFALIWWLTKTTGSATVLATATLAGLLPQVILGPLTGALVDRWNRRRLMIAADSLIALATLVLAGLFLTGTAQTWHVYLLMFFRSVMGGIHWAAMQSSTSLMVPKENLSRVQGANQVLNGGMSIISAPLGALVLDLLPMQGVLLIDVFTAIMAVFPLLVIAVPEPVRVEAPSQEKPSSIWSDMGAGFKYVAAWPGLLMIMGMATVINLILTPAFSLLPLVVVKHFNGQAFQLAWLDSAVGVGVILGGSALGVWGGFHKRIMTSVIGLLLMSGATMVFGMLPGTAFKIGIVSMFFMGIAMPFVNGPLMAIIQGSVRPDMQGRVFTLLNSLSGAMSPIGLMIAGPVSDRISVLSWFLFAGITIFTITVAMVFIPAVLNIEEDHRKKDLPVQFEPVKELDYT